MVPSPRMPNQAPLHSLNFATLGIMALLSHVSIPCMPNQEPPHSLRFAALAVTPSVSSIVEGTLLGAICNTPHGLQQVI